MPISFPQTTRALQSDQDKISLFALAFMLIMLAVWGIWLFTAQIHSYTSSQQLELNRNPHPKWLEINGNRRAVPFTQYTIQAHFDPEDVQKIESGQTAKIVLESNTTLPMRPLTSSVKNVFPQTGNVELEINIPGNESDPFDQAKLARLDVAVSSQTPLAFLFHLATKQSTSGQTDKGNVF